MTPLFQGSIYDFQKQRLAGAVAEVKALSASDLLDPSLAGKLDKIADQHFNVAVATLRPEERRGRHRDVPSQGTEFGRPVVRKVSYIDVTIPFNGDATSFSFAPSSSHVIMENTLIQDGAIGVSLLDDSNLDKNVDDIIKRVGENLDRIRAEMEQWRPHARKTLDQVAEQRIAELKAQKERDKGRSFPIN